MKRRYYTEPLFKMPPNTLFVYGSNISGRHGLGAALIARRFFGAIYGIGSGLQGQSYAIPTKDEHLNILPLNVIEQYVEEFCSFTHMTDYEYYVTPIGTGLAGYKHKDIAPMFTDADNCMFPAQWERYF